MFCGIFRAAAHGKRMTFDGIQAGYHKKVTNMIPEVGR